jgi:O-antigen/teichoic acid export membrane protein
MMRLNRLAGFSAGPILSLLCSLATVPAVAWLFPPADIGRLDFFMTACTVAGLLLSLGLDKAFLHEYHYSTRRSSLLKACLLPAVLLAPVVLAVILLFAALVSQLLFDVAQPALAFLFAAGMLSAVANRLIAQLFRMQERAWVFSLAQVLPKMTLLLLLPVLWLDPQRNFVHLASVVVATTWLVTLWLLWHARVSLAQAWSAALDRLLLRRLLSEAGPLLVSAIGYLSMLSAGMGLLRFFAGFDELGIYALAMRVAAGAWLVQSIFTIVWIPQVHKWAAAGGDLSNIAAICRHAQAVVVVGFCLAGALAWLIGWVLPSNYHGVAYLAVATVGQPLLYALAEVTGVGINLARRPSLSIAAFAAGLLGTLLAGAVLVPRCGAMGAVVSQLLGFLVYFVVKTELGMRVWRPLPRRSLYLGAFLLSLLAVGHAFFAQRLGPLAPLGWCVLLAAALYGYRLSLRAGLMLLKSGQQQH